MHKIVLTGGHAGSTAYSLIQELKKGKKDTEIYFIGSKKATASGEGSTFESKVLSKDVKFININAGKIQTKFTFWTIPSLLKIPIGFIHAVKLLWQIKPKVIVSFGGFAGFPVVLAGWVLGIPVLVHEQTAAAGRANEMSRFFADKILLARESSLKYFPRQKSLVIGNPLSNQIKSVKHKYKKGNPPTILITGGSRGSVIINNTIKQLLPELLKKFDVIHQTGEIDYRKFADLKNNLQSDLKGKYDVFSFSEPQLWKKYFDRADIVISRAGANTVSELMYIKRPCILIPLSIAYKNEQYENAKLAQDYGIAKILDEGSLNKDTLLEDINYLNNNWTDIVTRLANTKSLDEDATGKFAEIVYEYIEI